MERLTDKYWICHFAERRVDDLIAIPQEYTIHTDFAALAPEIEIRAAFARIHALFARIYADMAASPESFGLPLHTKAEFRNFSQQCRDAAQATYRPLKLLYKLLTGGDEKITNANYLFQKLSGYGFSFEGLKNFKPAGKDVIVSYPDDASLPRLLKMLAEKARNIDRETDFLQCSFRLLRDDMHTRGYSDFDSFIDSFPVEAEKAFIAKMDEALTSAGLLRGTLVGYYYRTESQAKSRGPYSFRLVNVNKWNPWHSEVKPEKLELRLRIRNAYKCMDYLKTCPDSVRRVFTSKSDEGCMNRGDGTCKHGVAYELDGQAYWRCGCCEAPFGLMQPKIEDIPYYIRLAELGEKR